MRGWESEGGVMVVGGVDRAMTGEWGGCEGGAGRL